MAVPAHFGLKSEPFLPVHAASGFVSGEAQRRALAHLRYGIKQGEGVVIVTGDEGVGKSTLLSVLMDEYSSENRRFIVLDGAEVSLQNLSKLLCQRLESDGETSTHLEDALVDLWEDGIAVSLVIDNADQLSDDLLEEIRKFSNLFHDGEALLQIALAGRTPMRSILYRADMEAFRQRIIASYHLPPMTPAETEHYVSHRLEAAGATGTIFDEKAFPILVERSQGISGRVDRLAQNALEIAMDQGRTKVLAEDIEAAKIDSHITHIAEPVLRKEAKPPVSVADLNQAIETLAGQNLSKTTTPNLSSVDGQSDVDVWEQSATFSTEEEAQLDGTSIESVTENSFGEGEVREALREFLSETMTTLESLRVTMNELRRETEAIEMDRQKTRENISERIKRISTRLDDARRES